MAGSIKGFWRRNPLFIGFLILAVGVAFSLKIGFDEVNNRQKSDARETKDRQYSVCLGTNKVKHEIIDYLDKLGQGAPTLQVPVNAYNMPESVAKFITDSREASRNFSAAQAVNAKQQFRIILCKK